MSLLEEPEALSVGAPRTEIPSMPEPVGPLSRFTLAVMRDPFRSASVTEIVGLDLDDPLADLDFQLSLYCLHELHYRSFAGVHPDAEWHPSVVDWWHRMAGRFEVALRAEVPIRHHVTGRAGDAIDDVIASSDGPSLSRYILDHAGDPGAVDMVREFAIHRTAYQLKEADPHTFALPRFAGPAKAAMVQIQMDEYGQGVPGRSHAELYAATLEALGLDPRYGHYLPDLPATTLATVNLMSHLALHRRLLPALLGHLGLFEMTSVVPMRRYAAALRRIGAPDEACEFYDTHVVADEHHGPLARSVMVDGYVATDPACAPLVIWGAEITMAIERRFAEHLLASWAEGRSSLVGGRPPR